MSAFIVLTSCGTSFCRIFVEQNIPPLLWYHVFTYLFSFHSFSSPLIISCYSLLFPLPFLPLRFPPSTPFPYISYFILHPRYYVSSPFLFACSPPFPLLLLLIFCLFFLLPSLPHLFLLSSPYPPFYSIFFLFTSV